MKKMIKLSLVTAIAVVGLSTTASAGQFGAELAVQKVELEGMIKYKGTGVNIQKDLGLDEEDITIIPTITYTSGNHKVFLNYQNAKFDGTNTLVSDITYNGNAYTSSTVVSSNFETTWYQTGYRYNLGNVIPQLNIAAGLDINVVDIDTQISGGGTTTSYSETVAIPALAADISYDFGKAAINAEIAYLPLGSNGNYLEYYAGVEIKCQKIKGLAFDMGYSVKDVDFKDGNDELDLDWKGFYTGVSYQF